MGIEEIEQYLKEHEERRKKHMSGMPISGEGELAIFLVGGVLLMYTVVLLRFLWEYLN